MALRNVSVLPNHNTASQTRKPRYECCKAGKDCTLNIFLHFLNVCTLHRKILSYIAYLRSIFNVVDQILIK
jgi:hypothetical protein